MKRMFLLVLIILVFLLIKISSAQDFNSNLSHEDQEISFNKHSVEVRVAYLNQKNSGVTVQAGPVSVNAGFGGIAGKVIYTYYPNYKYAFFLSVGGATPEVTVESFSFFSGNVGTYTSTVGTIMMGVKYFLLDFREEKFFRPYLTGGMQMLIGSENNVGILNIETHTESAMGAYMGFGAELLIASWLKFGAEMGYSLVTDFVEEIGSQKNYSGMEFSFGAGIMF